MEHDPGQVQHLLGAVAPEAVAVFQAAKILYAPGKAADAGDVSTSGLEMSRNSMRRNRGRDEVDGRLREIMVKIHEQCVRHGAEGRTIDHVKGANLAGFVKVADAMIDQGAV